MHRQIAVVVAATALPACSMIPVLYRGKGVADAGITTAIKDRREFNDRKLKSTSRHSVIPRWERSIGTPTSTFVNSSIGSAVGTGGAFRLIA